MDQVLKNNKAVKMFEEVRNLGNGKWILEDEQQLYLGLIMILVT